MTFNDNHKKNIKINENHIEKTKINKIKQKTLNTDANQTKNTKPNDNH